MNSMTNRVDDEAKYSALPASYHLGMLRIPNLVNTSGNSIPATPNIAHRPLTSSACTYHLKFSGSSASPNGSNPLSPGRLINQSNIRKKKIYIYQWKKETFVLVLESGNDDLVPAIKISRRRQTREPFTFLGLNFKRTGG